MASLVAAIDAVTFGHPLFDLMSAPAWFANEVRFCAGVIRSHDPHAD